MNRSIQKQVKYHVARTLTTSQKRNTIFNKILEADDGDGQHGGKLKVLIDGDGMKLLMSIYQDYVSDDDYVEFPKFMRDVDNLLLNARGGKALTREERENFEEDRPATTKRAKKKKKKAKLETQQVEAQPLPDAPKELTSSINRAASISKFVAKARNNTINAI